jgi:hypothetical protein
MWRTMSKAIDDAQATALEAHKAKDQGKVRLYAKIVADRVSAIGNLQRNVFGELIEQLSKDRGRVAIHTAIQTDPPAMIIYDTDEEFYLDVAEGQAEMKKEPGGAQAFGFKSLKDPTIPMNPEGAD